MAGTGNDSMTYCKAFNHTAGRLVASGDARIYIEEIGNANAPVLIMLHGGFGTIEDFNNITPTLGQHFRLIGIDSRGHGRSSLGSAKLSYKVLESDLAAVIDDLGLREFSLFGFSDGGITAYRYAVGKDQRLQKVITVGASWEMNETEPCWEIISGMTGEVWKGMFPASYHAYLRLNPQPEYDKFAARVVNMWTDLSVDGHPGESMGEIDAEILVIRGDNDFLTSLESMARLKSLSDRVNLLNVPFAEHTAFDESPDIVLHAVAKFLGFELE
jgi:pimeloyl-ACP methyl ester carboxylesterase